MAPVIMGNAVRPKLGEELTNRDWLSSFSSGLTSTFVLRSYFLGTGKQLPGIGLTCSVMEFRDLPRRLGGPVVGETRSLSDHQH